MGLTLPPMGMLGFLSSRRWRWGLVVGRRGWGECYRACIDGGMDDVACSVGGEGLVVFAQVNVVC